LIKRRISEIGGQFLNANFNDMDVEIKVNADKTFQKIVGFGGAFTGSVDYNLDQMSDALRQTIYL
jgi:O-glycosyl hydrolase